MSIPVVSKRVWLSLSTILIVATLFSYYFLVYMKDREVELKQRKFRVLNQYAENLKQSHHDHTKKLKIELSIKGKTTKERDSIKIKIDSAKHEIIRPLFNESDFTELLFEVEGSILDQTFKNVLNEETLDSLLKSKDLSTVRMTEYVVNNETFLVFIHQFKIDDKTWRIFGFYAISQFNKQVRSVDTMLAMAAVLVLILLLLTMPLLKLWIMNELEKLKTINVWFSGFSIVVGSSFMLLVFLMTNDYYASYTSGARNGRDYRERENVLRDLSEDISNRFQGELEMIYNQLKEVEPEEKIFRKNYNSTLVDNVLGKKNITLNCYKYFNEIIWVDGSGRSKLVLATHQLDDSDKNITLEDRTYFSRALHGDSWYLPGTTSCENKRFSLQSIHSYQTKLHEAGFGINISQNAGESNVLAMATKLHSVMDPLLPPGYQFCIIDKEGDVWFHSNTEKNLKENFFDESEQDKKLIAAITGRFSMPLSISYEGASHRSFVEPIHNTDLFIITLHNDDYFKSPIVLIVGLASFLVFILLVIQGLHQAILLAFTYRFSRLKVQRFFMIWLRPRTEKLWAYKRSVLAQSVIAIAMSGLAFFLHRNYLVVCFLALPVLLHMFHYFMIEGKEIIKEEGIEKMRSLFYHPFFLSSLILVLLINLSGAYYLGTDKVWTTVSIQLFFVGILWSCMWWRPSKVMVKRLLKFKPNRRRRASAASRQSTFINFYYGFLLLWLFLASVLPTYFFYKVAYYEENKVWTRHLLMRMAALDEERDSHIDPELKKSFAETLDSIKSMGNYQSAGNQISSLLGNNQYDSIPDFRFYGLLFKEGPIISGEAEAARSAIYPRSGDGKWECMESGFETVLRYQTQNGDTRFYKAGFYPYRLLKGDYWVLYAVILVLMGYIIYRMLKFCITHIFGIGLLSRGSAKSLDLVEGGRHFIVGLPYSGTKHLIEGIKSKYNKEEVAEIDLSKDKWINKDRKCKIVIANNFQNDLNNHEVNERKLKLLSELQDDLQITIIIISTLESQVVLEFYDKLATYYLREKGDYELSGNYRTCKQAYRHWKNILSPYIIHYKALGRDSLMSDGYVAYELNHGVFLPKLSPFIKQPVSNEMEREDMILQVEEMSQTYYHSIWNSLCSAEKFILFDLAKDGFVNMRNMKTIRMLRQKGIVIVKDALRIMNKSFNNFILSVVNEDDEIKMEEEMRRKGTWNTMHLIIVIVIVSILIFLGIAQEEMFKNFQSILAAMGALLPLLARFGGIFLGSKVKE